jgi:hypothetical protein
VIEYLKEVNSLKLYATIGSIFFFYQISTDSIGAQFFELKGKKAVEQFLDYRFQKENDPIINQLQKQFQVEGMPPEFSEVVKDVELQKKYLMGYGLVDEKEKTKYAFLEFHQPLNKTVYSVYRKGKKAWALIGEISSECKYSGPALRFEKCPNLLLVSVLYGGGGTEVFENRWLVYAIDEDNLYPVLSYPNEGHRTGWGISYDVEFKSSEIKWDSSSKQIAGYMDLDIKYLQGYALAKQGNAEQILFKKNNRYYLSWSVLKGGFLWSKKDGEPTDPFGDILFFEGDEKFINKYKNEIEKISQESNPALKFWYAGFKESIKTHGLSKTEK